MTEENKHGSHTTINHLGPFEARLLCYQMCCTCSSKQRQTQLIIYSWMRDSGFIRALQQHVINRGTQCYHKYVSIFEYHLNTTAIHSDVFGHIKCNNVRFFFFSLIPTLKLGFNFSLRLSPTYGTQARIFSLSLFAA